MTAIVTRADAAHLPLPDASVDLIVTSPPYFALRSYQDGGEHYAGQIGSEASPQEFLEALWTCTREWMRVLKPSGSLFVNLGDKYAGGQPHSDHGTGASTLNGHGGDGTSKDRSGKFRRSAEFGTARPKSLMGLPWRYAIGCIDQLGLILRAELVWAKPNGLPESVTDRVRRSHEQWFHFTLQPRYFSAVDEIREPQQSLGKGRPWSGDVVGSVPTWGVENGSQGLRNGGRTTDQMNALNPLGKLPGSVWEIPSEPLTVPAHLGVDHFAAFPTAWPKRLILGWSPSGICTACGEPRRPVTDVEQEQIGRKSGRTIRQDDTGPNSRGWNGAGYAITRSTTTITGYACACPDTSAPTRPSVVLDPFGGTGTTAAVASALGRIGISVDLSHDYSRLAQWRTTDPATRAKIRGERPPVKQMDGQLGIFDGLEVAG